MKCLVVVLLLSGCTIQVQPSPELVDVVNNQGAVIKAHTEVLNQIATYVDELQKKGALPRPEEKKE